MEIRKKIYLEKGKRGKTEIVTSAPKAVVRRPSRKSELMAFAVVFDQWLKEGRVRDYADIAKLTGLSRYRVSKIMNYSLKTPKEQYGLLVN